MKSNQDIAEIGNVTRQKIITIHQPHFLPWMGYYNKLLNSDIFVVLDNVQFRKLYFQNRTYIKDMNGEKHLLSIPVSFKHDNQICDVRLVGDKWKLPLLRTIEYSYKQGLYFNHLWPTIEYAISSSKSFLLDLLLQTLLATTDLLGMNGLSILLASCISSEIEPTQRIIEICKKIGADTCIFGEGGSLSYHDLNLIEMNGIKIIRQDFKNNQPKYRQMWGGYLPNLSIIDPLFNIGANETRSILKETWEHIK